LCRFNYEWRSHSFSHSGRYLKTQDEVSSPDQTGVKPLAKKFKVKVDEATCKGCGICVHICETKGGKNLRYGQKRTLLGGSLPESVEKCTGCRWCERYCPDFAITVEEEKIDA
jgi:2-oxoglutarate ferredoxin oxidoreductase subunit delta